MSSTPKILLLHWGQSGGGPRFLYEITQEWNRLAPGQVTWSFDAGMEEAAKYRDLNLPSLQVTTYRRSKTGFIIGLARLPNLGRSLRHFIEEHGINTFVSVMPSHFQSLLAPIVVPDSVHYVAFIHDAVPHLGEGGFLRALPRTREIERADQIVVFSQSVADQVSSIRPELAPTLIKTVHPAWDTDEQVKTEARLLPLDKPVTLGFFGRLYAYKGLDLFVEAARILLNRGVDVRIEVHGQGPDGAIKDQASDIPGHWNINWIPEEKIESIMRNIDVLILPYKVASQSGVFAQALTYGIPCVGTPVGGLREQLEETSAGIIAEDVSAAALANAIEGLLADRERYSEIARRALTASSVTHTWTRVVNDIAEGLVRSS